MAKQGNMIELKIDIPVNTTAVVYLPGDISSITEGDQKLDKADGIIKYGKEKDQYVVNLGSGRYVFRIASPQPSPQVE
jgi:hypothetical protein